MKKQKRKFVFLPRSRLKKPMRLNKNKTRCILPNGRTLTIYVL